MTLSDFHNRLLGDTLCIVVAIFKQNFKVKCESRNTKAIIWRYTTINNIIYENMLILTARILACYSQIQHTTGHRKSTKTLIHGLADVDMAYSG
jgi:hypothetical protein